MIVKTIKQIVKIILLKVMLIARVQNKTFVE